MLGGASVVRVERVAMSFEIMGYYIYFVCTACGWGRWVLGVILWDGSEEPLFYAGHVRFNVLLMGQAWWKVVAG